MEIAALFRTTGRASPWQPLKRHVLNSAGTKKASDLKGPLGFVRKMWTLAKLPEDVRKISNLQLISATMPVLMGILGIPSLLASNYLRDPSSAPEPDKQKWLTALGKSFQIVFEILTVNNVVLAALNATPARFITYSLLAIANAYFGQFEWKQIDLCNEIRDKNKEIRSLKESISHLKTTQSSEKKKLERKLQELIEEKREIYDKLDDAESQSNFFARVLMNIIMAFSFGYFPSHISPSAKYGKLGHIHQGMEITPEMEKNRELYTNGYSWEEFQKGIDLNVPDSDKVGPYKACHTNGYTWNDIWNGVPDGPTPFDRTPSWPKLMIFNAKREWNAFKEGCANTWRAFKNPKTNAQGTLWGHNDVIEAKLGNGPGQVPDTFFNRWRVRLSGGLLPISLNNLNIIARFGITAMAAGAISLLGMGAYNKEKPVDEDLVDDDQSQQANSAVSENTNDLQNSIGEFCLDGSKSMIWWGRMLSGISGLLNTFNPNFLSVSGVPAMALNGVASAFSVFSAAAGGVPGLATVDIFTQFLSTIGFNACSGLASINGQLQKDHIESLIEKELNRTTSHEKVRIA